MDETTRSGPDEALRPLERAEGEGLSVTFEVAEDRLVLEGFPAGGGFLEEHYPGFFSLEDRPAGRPALLVGCRLARRADTLEPPAPGATPEVVVEASGPELVETRSHWHAASLDCAAGTGEVVFTSLDPRRFRVSLDNFLRTAYANLLLRRGGCLLHAAAPVREEKAYVFMGPSGAGKSTVTALSRPLPALTDDLVALVPRDGLHAERVPFWGVYPPSERLAGRYPVAALLRIIQAEEHELLDLPRAAQVAILRACMPFLPPGEDRAVDAAERILEACPLRELRFARDAGFWELLDPSQSSRRE